MRQISTAACGAALILAQVCLAGSDAPLTLRYKFHAGDVNTYQTSGQITIPIGAILGQSASPKSPNASQKNDLTLPVTSLQKITVIKIESNGSADLEITTTAAMTMQPGQPAGTTNTSTIRYTSTPLGVLTTSKQAAETGGAGGLGEVSKMGSLGSISVYLPSAPVRIGSTWATKFAMPMGSGTATVTGKFVSMGQVGRYKTARIRLTVVIPLSTAVANKAMAQQGASAGGASISGKGTMTYDDDFAVQDGKLIRSTGSGVWNIVVTQNMPTATKGASQKMSVPVTAKITMSSTLVQ